MDPIYEKLDQRLTIVERKVERLFAWGAAALFASSVLGTGYIWFASRSVNQLDTVITATNTIQTDVVVVKREQERLTRDSDRAWRLVNTMIKKGTGDVSKSLNDDSP